MLYFLSFSLQTEKPNWGASLEHFSLFFILAELAFSWIHLFCQCSQVMFQELLYTLPTHILIAFTSEDISTF